MRSQPELSNLTARLNPSDKQQVMHTFPATLTNLQLVLLDRDGVINFDSPDYIKSLSEWRPIPGAIAAITKLQKHFAVAVCTNQSGIGRGLFDESMLARIHDKLNTMVESAGGRPMDVYYCPHHPDDGCPCRKPNPELLHHAMRAHNCAAGHTLYVGDSEKDLLAAQRAGCAGALVLTGNGMTTAVSQPGKRTAMVFEDLAACAKWLVPG